MEWIKFDLSNHHFQRECLAPFDGRPFLACIWGDSISSAWIGQAIYARHYDAGDRCPGKYEFFYICQNPEDSGWQVRIEDRPFPITHWMPLPEPPKE